MTKRSPGSRKGGKFFFHPMNKMMIRYILRGILVYGVTRGVEEISHPDREIRGRGTKTRFYIQRRRISCACTSKKKKKVFKRKRRAGNKSIGQQQVHYTNPLRRLAELQQQRKRPRGGVIHESVRPRLGFTPTLKRGKSYC